MPRRGRAAGDPASVKGRQHGGDGRARVRPVQCRGGRKVLEALELTQQRCRSSYVNPAIVPLLIIPVFFNATRTHYRHTCCIKCPHHEPTPLVLPYLPSPVHRLAPTTARKTFWPACCRRCEVEITGIARCNVKTMWMKGESFGLFEAVVELFRDEEQEEEHQGTVSKRPRGETADRAPETSERGRCVPCIHSPRAHCVFAGVGCFCSCCFS